MKAICTEKGTFKGRIPDTETYEKVLNGEADWKPHIKCRLEAVEIPYSLFKYLLELDKARKNAEDGK